MKNIHQINDNIYITNSEEIKEGDWFYNTISLKPEPFKACENGDGYVNCSKYSHYRIDCKKIILTTDPSLDGVQAIDNEFLEWFVKNPSCEFVKIVDDVECLPMPNIHIHKHIYKIIFPKEEPKQEIVGYRLNSHIDRNMVDGILKNAMPIWNDEDKSVYFIRGHVAGSLVAKMKELQVLDLWFTPIYEDEEIKSDWVKENHLEYYYKEGVMADKSNQETLEEAADNSLQDEINYWYEKTGSLTSEDIVRRAYSLGITEGAKWQQERMYSEAIEFAEWIRIKDFQTTEKDNWIGLELRYYTTEELFEQFKKK